MSAIGRGGGDRGQNWSKLPTDSTKKNCRHGGGVNNPEKLPTLFMGVPILKNRVPSCSKDIFICMFGTQAKIQGNIQIIMLDRVKEATLQLFLDFFIVLNKTEKPLST